MTADKVSTAVKEMLALFDNAWKPKLCHYPNQDFNLPAANVVWARWRCQHFTGNQATLSDVIGKRHYESGGTLFIQVFTPLNASEIASYDTAEIVSGAYEGKTTPSGVWFRNVRIQEITRDAQTGSSDDGSEAWNQKNVLVDFLYDRYR